MSDSRRGEPGWPMNYTINLVLGQGRLRFSIRQVEWPGCANGRCVCLPILLPGLAPELEHAFNFITELCNGNLLLSLS